MDQVKIGSFISTLRKEQNLTQEQLGEQLGVSQRTVSRWETGRNLPDISLLPAVSEALNVSVAELLEGQRLENNTLPRSEASALTRRLAELVQQKRSRRRTAGAILSAVLTVLCMLWLYHAEFNVSVTNTADLEQAIDDYHFADDLHSNVLERQAVGSHLFVLYGQEGYPGAGGLAHLERGIFGKYRILQADDFDYPLCFSSVQTLNRKPYFLTFCVNELPGVASYAYYNYDFLTDTPSNTPVYGADIVRTPFLHITELETKPSVTPYGARYYDAEGHEIPKEVLRAQFPDMEGAVNSGIGTAETGMIYWLEGILLLIGFYITRFFLTKQ